MPDSVFTAINRAPELAIQDQNFTMNAFLARKSAGLAYNATSGWRYPGPLTPGSYGAPLNTGTNKTMLGSTKSAVSLHVNSQEMTVQFGLEGITPFSLEVANKNQIAPVATYISAANSTVAAGGGTTTAITVASGTNFTAGMMIEIPLGTGNAAYLEYRRILSKSGNILTLDYPLFEAPADSAAIKGVEVIAYKKGGSGIQQWAAIFVASGDLYNDRMIHHAKDLRVSNGNPELPDGNVGKVTLAFEVFSAKESGEPVLMTEYLQFANAA